MEEEVSKLNVMNGVMDYDAFIFRNQKHVMRCDSVFHLLKVKSFTKKQLIRLIYMDEDACLIFTNGLRLKFSSFRSDGGGESEIVYIRFDFFGRNRALYRSRCWLEKCESSGNWNIRNEKILSRIQIGHLNEIIELYAGYTSGLEDFNLTRLRKIITKKSSRVVREILLENRTLDNKDNLEQLSEFPAKINSTRHILELQMHLGSLVFSHRQYDNANAEISLDYLVKNDIISNLDFLRLSRLIFALHEEQCASSEIGSSSNLLSHSSASKLDCICEQLANDRDRIENAKRKRRFREICDNAMTKTTLPLPVPNDDVKGTEINVSDFFFDLAVASSSKE